MPAAIPGDDEPPWQIGKHGERGYQHVVTFARHDRADREQADDAVAAWARWRGPVRAWRHDSDKIRRHSVVGNKAARGGGTRRNDARGGAERRLFTVTQRGGLGRAKTGLQRQRMMDDRDQRMT